MSLDARYIFVYDNLNYIEPSPMCKECHKNSWGEFKILNSSVTIDEKGE